jgi:hypothetical protein
MVCFDSLRCFFLFDNFRDQKQTPVYCGRAALVSFALVGLTHHIVTQAQRYFLNRGDWVCQGLNARGVNGLHGLNNAKKIVEFGKHALAFSGGEFQARQIGNARDVRRCQGHSEKRVETKGKSRFEAVSRKGHSRAIGYYPAFGANGGKTAFFTPN